jgi:hypothetical protein
MTIDSSKEACGRQSHATARAFARELKRFRLATRGVGSKAFPTLEGRRPVLWVLQMV